MAGELDFAGGLVGAGANLLGGIMANKNAKHIADLNIDMQKEFAQNGITWREADARRGEALYGINPLVALGAPTSSFSNVVGGDGGGSGVAAAGQDISRAMQAYAGANSRKALLEEKLLDAQIANVNSDTVKNQAAASKLATGAPTTPTPLYQDFRTDDGKILRLPSDKASQAMQNWGSMPAQASVFIDQLRSGAQREWHTLTDPIRDWVASHGALPVRGDAWRGADTSQYIPF